MLPLLRAPQTDRTYFLHPPPEDVQHTIHQNVERFRRLKITIDGMSVLELQRLLRSEIAPWTDPPLPEGSGSADCLLFVSGHQPELDHPGVWLKHFFLHGLSREFGAIPLHLVADHDLPKRNCLYVPRVPQTEREFATRAFVPYDSADVTTPYEFRPVYDAQLFSNLPRRLLPLAQAWNFEPLALQVWPRGVSPGLRLVDLLASIRRNLERQWGCRNHELPVSKLAQTEAFRRFARHLMTDLPRFRRIYNSTVQHFRDEQAVRQPVRSLAELEPDEAPFWEIRGKQRLRATRQSPLEALRPRAITLTLFCRLVLGPCFIHGLGGALYDQITDALSTEYFGEPPPVYLVVTATMYLPLSSAIGACCGVKPGDNGARLHPTLLRHLWRDVYWNPQRHLPADAPLEARQLAEHKLACIRHEPPREEHAARRRWFQTLRTLTESLRSYLGKSLQTLQHQYQLSQQCQKCQEVFRRRDYSWVLFPEDVLRPFLTQFLDWKHIIREQTCLLDDRCEGTQR
jgi:hypothetical protein